MVSVLDINQPMVQSQHQFKRREVFPQSYSRCWRIEEGIVRTLTWNTQGRVFVLGLWSKGDVVSQSFSNSDFCSIECLSSVTALLLPPSYSCHRVELLSYLRRTEALLQIVQMRTVKERLLWFLDYLAQQFGQETDDGMKLDFNLTHQDIAEAIGSSRVTVTRLMGTLHQNGKLSWCRTTNKRLLLIQPTITHSLTN